MFPTLSRSHIWSSSLGGADLASVTPGSFESDPGLLWSYWGLATGGASAKVLLNFLYATRVLRTPGLDRRTKVLKSYHACDLLIFDESG